MARLEIPSIVVHKGGRSESRPESPCTVVCEGGMPSLPASRQQGLAVGCSSSSSDSDMIETNASGQLHRSASVSVSSSSSSNNGPNDTEAKNYRNRTNTKVKLLVRSHAMRESTSPPREPQNGSVATSVPAVQPAAAQSECEPLNSGTGNNNNNNNNSSSSSATAVVVNTGNGGGGSGGGSPANPTANSKKSNHSGASLSPNSAGSNKQQQQQQLNNNNEPIYNSNLGASSQSPKQMRNSATSPTCRTSSRNGSSSPSLAHQKHPISPVNGNKSEGQRNKQNNASKCNNCAKNGQQQHDRPVLLQTPISPLKNQQKNAQNNHKNEQRRPNTLNVCNNQCSANCGNTLSVNRSNSRHKLRHQNSSQGSYDSASPSLSRDSSTELYTDSTGVDLEQFIAETINRNQKDRTVLLKIEKDLIEFAKDRQKVSHKFPNMSSYNRMLVHRVAAYFGMEHNVDQSGLSVIVTRTKNMRIPDTRFKEHIRDDLLLTEEPRRSILKRDSSSFEDSFNFKSPDRMSGDYCRRSKSFEEREEEYERARRRIFKDSSGESSEVTSWPYWSSSESSDASARYRLLHPSDHSVRQTRLLKGESLDGRETFRSNGLRPSVSKSFSFGGYTRGMLSRGDSVMSTHSAGARLMKQGTSVEDSGASMCSRLSPSSSGYKSQSQRSDATISPSPSPSPIPTMTCNHSQISSQDAVSPEPNGQTVMWAVTSLSSVPPGSVIINPQTNQPYTNPDGSLYRFDPDNPPKFFIEDMENRGTSKHSEAPEPHRPSGKNDGGSKKQRSQTTKHASNCGSTNNSAPAVTTTAPATTTTPTATTTSSGTTQVTNSSTSPSLPFTPPPAPPPPPPPLPAAQVVAQQPPPQPQLQPSVAQPQQQQPPPPPQPQQQQQPLVRAVPMQPCNHGQPIQPYATYVPTSEPYAQGVYPPGVAQQTVMMAPHSAHGQPAAQNGGQEDVFNQNPVYTNYTLPVQQPPLPQSGDVTELSNYFMGMNIYDQRGAGDNQTAPTHPYPQPPPPATNQTLPNVQPIQPNYWQTTANQMPPQQAMYFVSPPGTAIPVNQNPNDRQQLSQQQRFSTSYSINLQTMTPPSQTNANYISSYPVTYNSMPTVTSTPGEYTCQPPVQMVPAYYPGQSGIQPPPVMYRVPTPPNTPTSNQIPGVPLMYVNSGSYPPPAMMSAGTFGPQVGPNGTSPAPPGAYMAPAIVPNIVFRQNVPLVTGVRTSTPGSSQRASRSPTPAHDIFGGGNGDRSAQPPPRYPLPMYQGVHIVQGDMRLMHPGVPGNPRLQYAPVPSPPVIQGCPRPYRPPSYSSNASGGGTPTPFDGRNQKIRKQRSKIATLPPTVTRPNLYQSPSISSLSSNTPKDMREGTVKVTITRRNQLLQY